MRKMNKKKTLQEQLCTFWKRNLRDPFKCQSGVSRSVKGSVEGHLGADRTASKPLGSAHKPKLLTTQFHTSCKYFSCYYIKQIHEILPETYTYYNGGSLKLS